jgi:xyloglucan-specific exo-beta-1,4-glucanase
VRGDANTFGVVYRSTAGRGIVARIPSDWTGLSRPRVPRAAAPWSVSGASLRLEVLSGEAVFAEVLDLRGRRIAARQVRAGEPAYLADWVSRTGTYLVRIRLPGKAASAAFKATILK